MNTKKVLIIDDEKDLTFLISEIMEAQGNFDVYVANDGKEGMEKAAEVQPDIIFLDFVMPGAKGDEVLDFINTHCDKNNTAVILMSGLGEMVYFKKKDQWKWLPNRNVARERGEIPEPLKWKKSPEEIADELGVKGFLPKPFTQEMLLEVLRDVFSDDGQ